MLSINYASSGTIYTTGGGTMPSYGTHITMVERLAASSPDLRDVLGDPFAAPGTPEWKKMSFAKLGALGPDILYISAETTPETQEMQNFLIKVNGTFASLSTVMAEINNYVTGLLDIASAGVITDLQQTLQLVIGVIKTALIAELIDNGVNFFPWFESPRQQDKPREEWWWADFLHYVETGVLLYRV